MIIFACVGIVCSVASIVITCRGYERRWLDTQRVRIAPPGARWERRPVEKLMPLGWLLAALYVGLLFAAFMLASMS